jgi:histidine triad (HIT) family protein
MKALLFRIARSPIARLFIGWSFAYMSWAIPVERLVETPSLMAFHHPVPSHPVHILIVPKRSYANFLAVPPEDSEFQRDLFVTVAKLVKDFSLDKTAYRLVCNGGDYQDVPQLHFHLISDSPA